MFHAIASEDVKGSLRGRLRPAMCAAASRRAAVYALADATGGERISICVSDWSMVFGPLQRAVIESAPLPCDYAIPVPPNGASLDPNQVNFEFVAPATPAKTFPRARQMDACASEVAWYYDDPSAPKQNPHVPSGMRRHQRRRHVQIKLGCRPPR